MTLGPPIRTPVREQEERWERIGKTGAYRSTKTGKVETWIPANEVASGTAKPPWGEPEPEPEPPVDPEPEPFVPDIAGY